MDNGMKLSKIIIWKLEDNNYITHVIKLYNKIYYGVNFLRNSKLYKKYNGKGFFVSMYDDNGCCIYNLDFSSIPVADNKANILYL